MTIPSADFLSSQGVDRWILVVEVELTRACLAEQFPRTVPKEFVYCTAVVMVLML